MGVCVLCTPSSDVAGIPRALPQEVPVLRFILAASLALLALVLGACERADHAPSGRAPDARASHGAPERHVIDDFGDTLRLAGAGARIVSLNPTTTEVLFALGAGERLVGRSSWDEWPEAAKSVPAVGDAIRPNVEAILAARPTLVVLYASADNRPAARALRAAGVQTLAVRVDSIAEFRRVTRLLGLAAGRADAGAAVVDSVDATLARVRRLTISVPKPTVLWRAWEAPLMVIGVGSYITELLEIAGARNVFADDPRPSPQVSFEEVVRRDPDRMLTTSAVAADELRRDPRWRALRAVREGLVVIDGDLVARPSVRLGEAAVQLAQALHPELAIAPARAP